MNPILPSPWVWLPDAQEFSRELIRECPIGHPLHGISCQVLARREGCDDFLFRIDDGSGWLSVVHLTWHIETSLEFPHAVFFSSLSDFLARRAWPDSNNEKADAKTSAVHSQIWILEDDPVRQKEFIRVCDELGMPLALWNDATEMLFALEALSPAVRIISLDHDLYGPKGHDPGTGRDISQALALRAPQCPVILHTSNGDGRRRMQGDLEGSGWTVHHVPPFGEDWIGTDWRLVVRDILASHSGGEGLSVEEGK